MEILQHVKQTSSYVIRTHINYFIKRLFDIVISSLLLILLSPVFAYVAIRIYKEEGRPIIYKEPCAGRNHRPFIKYTFRIKTPKRQLIKAFPPYPFPERWKQGVPNIFHFRDESYTLYTEVGRKLKKYALHRLPILWNVLKGDMSIIGPRPERCVIADYYNRYQAGRLSVRPGMTGYAQMKQSESGYNDMVNQDIYYVHHMSQLLDMKVLYNNLLKSKKVN